MHTVGRRSEQRPARWKVPAIWPTVGLALPHDHPPARTSTVPQSPAAPPTSGTPAGYARPCQNIRPPTCRRLQLSTTRPPHATGCRTISAVHPAINGSIQAKLTLCPRPVAAPCPLLRVRQRVHPSGGGSVGRTRAPPSAGGEPTCPSARGRRRVPPSGGPVYLAPGAPPTPTVRRKLRVPPSGAGPVFPRPGCPLAPPPCMGGTVSPRGGAAPCSPVRGRHRLPPVGGGRVVSPPPRGLPGVPPSGGGPACPPVRAGG